MKKIACIVLCLVFVLALFVMPSSAAVASGDNLWGAGGGSFSPLNCFTLYRHLQGAMSVDSPFPSVTEITLNSVGGDPQYLYSNFNTTSAKFPNVTALYGTTTAYSLDRPINNFTLSSNSYLQSLSPSFSLCKVGERIEFSLNIFVRHNSGRNNTLLTAKTVSCKFRPYNGLRFYTSAEFPEISCDAQFNYIGLVEEAPDYESMIFRNGGTLAECSYDQYLVKCVFDYTFDTFTNSSMGSLPLYGFYDFDVSMTWSKPVAATAAFYTPVLLGDLEVSRFIGGYPVDIDGNVITPNFTDVLSSMKEYNKKAFSGITVSQGWASSFLDYVRQPIKFFNGFIGSVFRADHMPILANLAYTLIFISVGMILFGFAADFIPSLGRSYKSKFQRAESSARSSYGRYRLKSDQRKSYDDYYNHTEGRHYLPERRKR